MISCLIHLIEWNSKYIVTRGVVSAFHGRRTLCWCIFLASSLPEYLYLESFCALLMYAMAGNTRVESLS